MCMLSEAWVCVCVCEVVVVVGDSCHMITVLPVILRKVPSELNEQSLQTSLS